jgi:hypothetical protein
MKHGQDKYPARLSREVQWSLIFRLILVGDGEFDGGGGGEAGASEGRLVDHGAVRPLRGGDIVYFVAEAGGSEAAEGVGLGHADEVGHDVSGLAGALRD